VVRLNLETRGDKELLAELEVELLALLESV